MNPMKKNKTQTKTLLPSRRSNDSLSALNSVLLRSRIVLLLTVLIAVPFVVMRAGDALSDRNNDIRQWLPGELSQTKDYDWFLQQFGSEEFVVVSWQGATLTDGRVDKFATGLTDRSNFFREVLSGPQILSDLQSGRLALDEQEAKERMTGALLGPDGNTTAILVRLNDDGLADRHAAVADIRDIAAETGIDGSALRLGGPTMESVTLDVESERSRYVLSAFALLLSSVAAWRCLRSVTLMTTVLVIALFCAAASLAWVSVLGDQLNMIMITMPTLIYVLTISGSIHVTHYFQESVNEVGRERAMGRALQMAWVPCVLTAVTTAIGLGSLTVSHVLPVNLFGFYSAIGVLTGLPIVLLALPAVLSFLVYPQSDENAKESRQTEHRGFVANRLHSVAELVMRRNGLIAIAGISAMIIGAIGLTHLKTSVRIIDFFSPKSQIISDYQWLEENLGPLVPVEVVVRVPEENRMRMTQRVQMVRDVQQALKELAAVDGIVSAATYIPEAPPQRGLARLAGNAAVERKLQNATGELQDSGYLADDGSAQLWRISARVSAMEDLDYGLFVKRLQAAVDPVVADYQRDRDGADAELSVVYTGIVPLIYKAQRMLLNDLTTSFFSAFGLIAVVMQVLMKGLRSGLLSMLPNTFPAIVVFGLMGWLGWNVDIGAMITASVAMGIAVDDTIHFMSWFRRGLVQGMSRRDAIREAYQRCGLAMLQTTAICGLGMAAFAFSGFGPTSGFATLMVTLLLAAVVGDLVFLPALLAGPLGRVFEKRVRSSEAITESDGQTQPWLHSAPVPAAAALRGDGRSGLLQPPSMQTERRTAG